MLPDYELGLKKLLERLGSSHPHYLEALTYRHRLQENITRATVHGDTETLRAERSQIIEQLNRLALGALGVTFNSLFSADATLDELSHPLEDSADQKPLRQTDSDAGTGLRAILLRALRDPLWQAVAAIVAFLTLLVAILALMQSGGDDNNTRKSPIETITPAASDLGLLDRPAIDGPLWHQDTFAAPFGAQFVKFEPLLHIGSQMMKVTLHTSIVKNSELFSEHWHSWLMIIGCCYQ